MPGLNKVFLIGNLTRDPELRQLPSGSAVCSFGLAVNRRYTTSRGEDREETCFVDVEAWGRQGETVNNYLRKGSPALVEGRLAYDQWEDRETGRKRSRLRIHAERVQFLGSPGRGADVGPTGGRDDFSAGDDRPTPPREQEPRRNPPPQMPPFQELPPDDDQTEAPDDIPF